MVSRPLEAPAEPRPLRALLRQPAFLRLWLCGLVCGGLRWLELLAVGVYVLQTTGSATAVALATCARMAPMFLFGLVAGMLADRFDRKRLLQLQVGAVGLISLGQAVLAWQGALAYWHVVLGAFVSGTLWASDFPIRRTLLGEASGLARIGQAMALDSATSNATRMMGPALGGLLLEQTGLAGTLLLVGVCYGGAVLIIWPLAAAPAAHRTLGLLAPLIEGWHAVGANRVIQAVLAITVIVNLWGFAYISMVPVIGARQLGLGPTAIGLLAATEGLGALIGAFLFGVWARPANYLRVIFYASVLFLVALLGFALSLWWLLSGLLLLLSGITIAGFAVMQGTLAFLAAPPALRARMMGLVSVAIGAAPLGMLHVGVLAEWFGAGPAVAIIAVEGLAAMIATGLTWPELRRPSPRLGQPPPT